MGVGVDGLVLLGCNLAASTTSISRFFAGFVPGDPAGVLPQLRALTQEIDSLPDWLSLHRYLVYTLGKFGTDVEGVQRYAADVVVPFSEAGDSPFIEWYRAAVAQITKH